ncbi:MAG: VIT1/CCC1 transporter family protein [Candidatus Hermodarchaeota archaeon]
MGIKATLKKWQKYSQMSDLGIISRRKFFNNCFDGALTCAGIVSGLFIIFLSPNGSNITPSNVIITGFATALAIGISGLWGAFLSEEAERKKKLMDLKKEMVILQKEEGEIDNESIEKEKLELAKRLLEEKEIKKAMVIPIQSKNTNNERHILVPIEQNQKKDKKSKTLIEQAEKFATIVASIVDGGAPVIGSSLPLIPFFFGTVLSLFHFIFSYVILTGLLIYLGFFLGKISGGGRIKYALHLVTAGIITLLISLLLGI